MHRSYLSGPSTAPVPTHCRGPLRPLAPLDDGSDTADMAERLLRAATLLPEARLDCRLRSGHFTWHGQLAEPNLDGGTLRLCGSHLVANVDLDSVLAVSYCADATSSGICLYDEGGAFLTLWSTHGDAFDAWLENTLCDHAGQIDTHGPTRARWSLPQRTPQAARTSRAP